MRIRLTLTAVVLAIAAPAPSAQDQGTRPTQPTFRGGVNVVRVDLFATRDGRVVDDLQATDVEILEDGVTQMIDAFEFVRVRPSVAQELRAEPNSVAESRQLAADARARVFVIFLDTYHTQIESSARMRSPLLQFVDRVVGQDDLVGLMTPEMSASDVTLGRRTAVISRLLDANTFWGRRARTGADNDPDEDNYEACYFGEDRPIAVEMKARRREKLSLDALDDLVVHLGGLRDERKAILAVTEGWLEYAPNPQLARQVKRDEGRIPNPPAIVGRGTRNDPASSAAGLRTKCESDRVALANMDNRDRLRQIGESANRVNVTFYPVGAQGLAVFDSPIGPDRPPPLGTDLANLRTRQNNMRLLADQTDGVAIVNTNNINPLLKKVVDDMSSYYLMTYSSTNTKLDGRFRSISVRVSRPGVQTRARRGYRALTARELPPGVASSTGAAPAASAGQTAVLAALNAMAFNPRAEMRLRASAGQGAFWLVGTLDDTIRRGREWTTGGVVDVAVRGGDGRVVLTKTVPITAADGGFAIQVPDGGGLAAGDYSIRVRAKSAAGATIDEAARVTIAAEPPAVGDAVVWRRRPATGPAFLRTGDPRASRTDRLRFEYATTAAGEPSATLLDRAGKPMAVPLQVSAREEAGVRWIVVETALAPLAPADYAVEVKAGEATRTTAFRVVP